MTAMAALDDFNGGAAQAAADDVKVLPADKTLARRAKTGVGVPLDQLVERGKQVVTKLSGVFEVTLQQGLEDMSALQDRIAVDNPKLKEDCTRLERIAHDLKGQGATFGWPLVTMILASLVRGLRREITTTEKRVELIHVHLGALKLVVQNKRKGKPTPAEEKMVIALDDAVARLTVGEEPI